MKCYMLVRHISVFKGSGCIRAKSFRVRCVSAVLRHCKPSAGNHVVWETFPGKSTKINKTSRGRQILSRRQRCEFCPIYLNRYVRLGLSVRCYRILAPSGSEVRCGTPKKKRNGIWLTLCLAYSVDSCVQAEWPGTCDNIEWNWTLRTELQQQQQAAATLLLLLLLLLIRLEVEDVRCSDC
jgi:hypothetical protein